MIEQLKVNLNRTSNILLSMNAIKAEDVPLTDMLFSIFDNAISYENNSL